MTIEMQQTLEREMDDALAIEDAGAGGGETGREHRRTLGDVLEDLLKGFRGE